MSRVRSVDRHDPHRSDAAAAHDPYGETPSDRELLNGCREGRADAWDALVTRYESLVFSVAIHGGLGREDAADITQATFVALLDRMSSLRADDRLPSWLVTVALRQVWRTKRRLERELPDGLHGDLAVDPQQEWEHLAALHEAIARLGSPCHELIHALYFDPSQPTYALIARRMGRAPGGLGPLRGRCLERLRSLLEEDL